MCFSLHPNSGPQAVCHLFSEIFLHHFQGLEDGQTLSAGQDIEIKDISCFATLSKSLKLRDYSVPHSLRITLELSSLALCLAGIGRKFRGRETGRNAQPRGSWRCASLTQAIGFVDAGILVAQPAVQRRGAHMTSKTTPAGWLAGWLAVSSMLGGAVKGFGDCLCVCFWVWCRINQLSYN